MYAGRPFWALIVASQWAIHVGKFRAVKNPFTFFHGSHFSCELKDSCEVENCPNVWWWNIRLLPLKYAYSGSFCVCWVRLKGHNLISSSTREFREWKIHLSISREHFHNYYFYTTSSAQLNSQISRAVWKFYDVLPVCDYKNKSKFSKN